MPFAEPTFRDNLSRDQPRQVRMRRPRLETQSLAAEPPKGLSPAFGGRADASADCTKADRSSR